MKRTADEGAPNSSASKKPRLAQATLSFFYSKPDGQPLSNIPNIVPEAEVYSRPCPYCDFVAKSPVEKSLAGALTVHLAIKHPFEHFESSVRLESAFSYVQRTIFDLNPLDTLEEVDEEEDDEKDKDRGEPALAEVSAGSGAKRQRHSYSIKKKFKILQLYSQAQAVVKSKLSPEDPLFSISVVEYVSNTTGVPTNTLKDWIAGREAIESTYHTEKRKRKLKRSGSPGRKPLFPKAEKIVAERVRDKRKKCKLVSKRYILKEFQEEAKKEDPTAYATCKWTPEIISGFMRRNRLSLRFPSCKRSENLEDSILVCRAFHRDLLEVLADTGVVKYAKSMHPEFGRFLLKYRFNADELPYRFGRIKSIVSEVGEGLTHVTYPPGWEARLATIMLIMDANGCLVGPVPVIFAGSFYKESAKRKAEVSDYLRKYPNVKPIFQKKAWMDSDVLEFVMKEVLTRSIFL